MWKGLHKERNSLNLWYELNMMNNMGNCMGLIDQSVTFSYSTFTKTSKTIRTRIEVATADIPRTESFIFCTLLTNSGILSCFKTWQTEKNLYGKS